MHLSSSIMEQSGVNALEIVCGEKATTPNVWMMPCVFGSHVLCFTQLATHLASHGLSVTILSSKDELDHLQASQQEMIQGWKRRGLDIRLRDLQVKQISYVDGPGVMKTIGELLELAADAFDVALETECATGIKPTCVIADLRFSRARCRTRPWNVASQLGCSAPSPHLTSRPCSTFITSAPRGFSSSNDLPTDEESMDEVISLPGVGLSRIRDIPTSFFKASELHSRATRHALSLRNADVFLLSSFQELEPKSFHELRNLVTAWAKNDGRKTPQVWTVGPTFPLLSNGDDIQVEGEEIHPSLKFLDSQPPASVLLVAFGGLVRHTPEQMEEIALGLENSEQPFLCVLQAPKIISGPAIDSIFSVIPPECVERTQGRGLFLQGWIPQRKVLAHPSIGGFASHCGHNSMLESICMGVPILGWPSFEDQFLNCRFVVDEARVGLEVKGSEGFVDRREVERSVRALFSNQEVRNNALKARQLARETVGENGSTARNIQALVALIKGVHIPSLK